MTRGRRPLVACLLLATTACGGVHHTLRADLPAPQTIAVLPFAGPADAPTREAARALVHSRFAARGYRVVEAAWVDRILSERGWLRDPAAFAPDVAEMSLVLEALDVDAVVIGRDIEENRFNILLLRRHAFGGMLAVQGAAGTWWTANHSAGAWGGFLLTSGQVFEELRAQGNHGTPMATLALVDEFVSDVAGALPQRTPMTTNDVEPAVDGITARQVANPTGGQRLVVECRATPGCIVQAELLPLVQGVPMIAVSGQPGRYRGSHDLPPDTTPGTIAVRARTRFGRETRSEVTP